MENVMKMIDSISQLEKVMNTVSIEFGVFSEDGTKSEKVTVYNLDDTTSEIEMNVSDIMFFTEYGTINLPPRPVLKDISRILKPRIVQIVNYVVDQTQTRFDRSLLYSEFNKLENEANNSIIPMVINNMLASNSTISNILQQKDDTPYIFDLNKLKKYIKCKIFFKS